MHYTFALSAFFFDSSAFRFSLPALMASCLAAALASGRLPLQQPRRGLHGTTFLDHVKGGTHDGTLVFHGTASPFLDDFLRDTLLVHSPVEDGPAYFPGVLALFE
jgi:hypothetical protein